VRFLTMLSAVVMTAYRVSRCVEWIAISVPLQALSMVIFCTVKEEYCKQISIA